MFAALGPQIAAGRGRRAGSLCPMSELHRQADKLDTEYDLLERMRDGDYDDANHVKIMLQQTKRVRREASHLVRLLAQQRDNLQS